MQASAHDIFFHALEERFRGSRAQVKAQMQAYLPFLRPLISETKKSPAAIDLACGRGEWLEILRDLGFLASGLELDPINLATCRMFGLQATQEDPLIALKAIPSNSLSLVSAFRLSEQMPLQEVRLIVHESLRVLKPGGLFVFEAMNFESFIVEALATRIPIPSVRPMTPDLMGFTVSHAGFYRHLIARFQEDPQLKSQIKIGLLEALSGVSPTFSVIAQKGATLSILSAMDEPFSISYGMNLRDLIKYYRKEKNHILEMADERQKNWATYVENVFAQNTERSTYLENRLITEVDRITERSTYLENRLVTEVDRITERSTYLENRLLLEANQTQEYFTYLKDSLISEAERATQYSINLEKKLAVDELKNKHRFSKLEVQLIAEAERINMALEGLYFQLEPIRPLIQVVANLQYNINRVKIWIVKPFHIKKRLRSASISLLRNIGLYNLARSSYRRLRPRPAIKKLAEQNELEGFDDLSGRARHLALELKQEMKKARKGS